MHAVRDRPGFEHRKPPGKAFVQLAPESSLRASPGKIVHVSRGGGAVEPGNLFGHVLLEAYGLDLWQWTAVAVVYRHGDPPSPYGLEPWRGREVELG